MLRQDVLVQKTKAGFQHALLIGRYINEIFCESSVNKHETPKLSPEKIKVFLTKHGGIQPKACLAMLEKMAVGVR